MESIDKITLELLTNKQQYNKYLSKEDPQKYKEHQIYLEKIKKYKSKILNLSKQFLENPEMSFNLEMNEMFSFFAKTSIKYIELRELENENQYNIGREKVNAEEDEENMMFGKMDEQSTNEYTGEGEDDDFNLEKSDETYTNYKNNQSNKMTSYWGKTIKKTNVPKYNLDMFMNGRKNGF
jgi:hypothetical protein